MVSSLLGKIFGTKSGKAAGTVLVVDDEPAMRELFEFHLGTLGYTVKKAGDGAAAMEMIEGGLIPDVVVLDVMMPGVNGLDLAKSIRKETATKSVPVVFVSGAYSPSELARLQESFPNSAALPKPFSGAKLKAAIDGLRPAAAPAKRKRSSNGRARLPNRKA